MQIDWIAGAVGGGLIGLSAALFLLLAGRTAGISGLLGGILEPWKTDFSWKFLFLLGVALGAVACVYALAPPIGVRSVSINPSIGVLLLAGFCVGLGTRIAGGCTSGHGVCGIPRFSKRSMVAVATFFATALLTASVL